MWSRFRRRRCGRAGAAVLLFLLLVAFLRPVLASRLPILCKYRGAWHFPGLIETIRTVPLVPSVVGPSRPFALASFDARAGVAESTVVIPALIPYDPLEYSSDVLRPASWAHWLGTDELGRDVAARLVHGTAVSLRIGFAAMGVAAIIGVLLGACAGYAGGWVDAVISRVIEVFMCFPAFFLVLALAVWIDQPGVGQVAMLIGLTGWTPIARLTRAEMIRLRESSFAVASRALGARRRRVVFRHLLPNALAPVIVTISFGIANAVLVEAGLSWLGFGVPAPNPSWGVMLRSAYDHMLTAPHLVYPPCIALFVTVLAYNWIGDALREATDPRANPAWA
jgi:peptide/nickel transport system permease protein